MKKVVDERRPVVLSFENAAEGTLGSWFVGENALHCNRRCFETLLDGDVCVRFLLSRVPRARVFGLVLLFFGIHVVADASLLSFLLIRRH